MRGKIKHLLLTSLIVIMANVTLANARPETSHRQVVLEVVLFTVDKHASANTVQKLAFSITPILKKYPGFISREFAANAQAGNQYIDIVKWQSLRDAAYAAEHIVHNRKMKRFIAVMQYYKMCHFKLTAV